MSNDSIRAVENDSMIIIEMPLRLTLGGGGTDLPSHYYRFKGLARALIS